ncbi:MAG: hypothetical protein AAF970_08900, partial [Bacteroidota bacterium]
LGGWPLAHPEPDAETVLVSSEGPRELQMRVTVLDTTGTVVSEEVRSTPFYLDFLSEVFHVKVELAEIPTACGDEAAPERRASAFRVEQEDGPGLGIGSACTVVDMKVDLRKSIPQALVGIYLVTPRP